MQANLIFKYTKNVWLLCGEVNSVKKHNYKIWLNDGVYYKEILHVSAYSGHLQVLTIFC